MLMNGQMGQYIEVIYAAERRFGCLAEGPG